MRSKRAKYCYQEFPALAARLDIPLGRCYWGDTHPCHTGYAVLWQTIAEGLGLLPVTPDNGLHQPEPVEEISYIGFNREDLSADLAADATDESGEHIYPLGISWYFTLNEFSPDCPYGGFIETELREDGTAIQTVRSTDYVPAYYVKTRNFADGQWTAWIDY